jgi:hypothetical protein
LNDFTDGQLHNEVAVGYGRTGAGNSVVIQ